MKNLKLRKLKEDSEGGVIFDWILIMASIFIVLITYTVLNHAISTELMSVGKDLGGNQHGALDFLDTVWTLFPWIFCGGLVLYGIVRASSRREYDTGWRL